MTPPGNEYISNTGSAQRVLVAGASGYIGQALVAELVARGHSVVALLRPAGPEEPFLPGLLDGSEVRRAPVTNPERLRLDGFAATQFDVVISCLAGRGGGVEESWRIDHQANRNLLNAALASGVPRFMLLSAICVQKPRLAFQHAKLAFERELESAAIEHCIVRPTAYFKSLAGQLRRVAAGKSLLIFGNGELERCKPLSRLDLAAYMADCLDDPARWNKTLPIGGPGPALNARERGELLFRALGRKPHYRRVPLALMDTIIAGLSLAGRLHKPWLDRAEFARIGRYYASESMLLWNEDGQYYDDEATPETGSDRLVDFYRELVAAGVETGLGEHDLGEQAVFDRQGSHKDDQQA